MKIQLRCLILSVLSLFPLSSFGALPAESTIGQARRADLHWINLLEKLINNRMPMSYYELLNQNGIYSLEQLMSLDDSIKKQLLKMYRDDLVIMAGNDQTRSIW